MYLKTKLNKKYINPNGHVDVLYSFEDFPY